MPRISQFLSHVRMRSYADRDIVRLSVHHTPVLVKTAKHIAEILSHPDNYRNLTPLQNSRALNPHGVG